MVVRASATRTCIQVGMKADRCLALYNIQINNNLVGEKWSRNEHKETETNEEVRYRSRHHNAKPNAYQGELLAKPATAH